MTPLSWIGLALSLGTGVVYVARLVLFRAARRLRPHDALIAAGAILGAIAAWRAGIDWRTWLNAGSAALWFVLTRTELRLRGTAATVAAGDSLPAFEAKTTTGETRTDRDVASHAPALVVFFRGKW